MSFGGSQKVTQTNKTELTPQQKHLQNQGIGLIDTVVGPNGQLNANLEDIAGFDPLQDQAQAGVQAKAGAGGSTSNLANAYTEMSEFLSGDVLSPESNPALQRTIDAAIRPLTETYLSDIMPSLRTGAISAGALGDPKQKQFAQLAADRHARQVGDTAAGISTTAYGQGLDAMTKNLAFAPQTLQASLFPESVMEAIGGQRRGLEQAQSDRRFQQDTLPLTIGNQLINTSAGAPGGGSTSTVSNSGGGTNWTQILGTGISALAGLPFL